LKDNFLRNAKVQSPDSLPERYIIWHNSMTGDTIYFAPSGEEFLQFSLSVIAQFIGKGEGVTLIGEITKRIYTKRGASRQKQKGFEK
jgi:hypothetical protein